MRAAFSGFNKELNAKAGLKTIRPGDLFILKVSENKEGQKGVLLKGRFFKLQTDQNLISGRKIQVRARIRAGRIEFEHVTNREKGSGTVPFVGSREDSVVDYILRRAAAGGLIIRKRLMLTVKRFLRKHPAPSDDESSAFIELIKKNLYSESMLSFLTSCGDRRGGDERALLFNHMQKGDELWFIKPFCFKGDQADLPGSIRIKKNRKTNKVIKYVIETIYKDHRIFFEIDNLNIRKMKIYYEDRLGSGDKKKFIAGVHEILDNKDVKFDDNITTQCLKKHAFDGFESYSVKTDGVEEII